MYLYTIIIYTNCNSYLPFGFKYSFEKIKSNHFGPMALPMQVYTVEMRNTHLKVYVLYVTLPPCAREGVDIV